MFRTVDRATRAIHSATTELLKYLVSESHEHFVPNGLD